MFAIRLSYYDGNPLGTLHIVTHPDFMIQTLTAGKGPYVLKARQFIPELKPQRGGPYGYFVTDGGVIERAWNWDRSWGCAASQADAWNDVMEYRAESTRG